MSWQALDFCFTHQITIPSFCLEYLQLAAAKIRDLVADATMATLSLDEDGKRKLKPQLTSQQAVAEASRVLGFTSPKNNAFRNIASEFDVGQTALQEDKIKELVRSKLVTKADTTCASVGARSTKEELITAGA